MTIIVGNDPFEQELGTKRRQSDMHNTPLVTILQATCLKEKKKEKKNMLQWRQTG